MSSPLLIKDLVKFVLRHRCRQTRRGTRAFVDVSIPALTALFYLYAPTGALRVVTDPTTGEITGVMLAYIKRCQGKPLLYVDQVLCSTRHAFRALCQEARQRFPGVALFGLQLGKVQVYRNIRRQQPTVYQERTY